MRRRPKRVHWGPALSSPNKIPHDPARDHYHHAHRHSAGHDGLRNQPSADAEGIARGDPNPSDAQTTPSPASPEIAAETVARGIALGVSTGLPDHEGIGGEQTDGLQEIADRQRRPGDLRDALGSVGGEIADAAADGAANAHAPDAADRQVDSMHSEQGPTSTPANGAEENVEEEERARALGGGQAQTRRGAQQREDEEQQAPELGAGQAGRSPRYSLARDRDPRLGPLRRSTEPRTPAAAGRQRRGRGSTSVPQQARRDAAAGTTPRGIRVARGGRRGGSRGGVTVQRRGASSFARAAHRILRGRAGDGEESSDENNVGDPLFNPEREGSSSPSPQVDEAEQHEELDRNPTHSRGASAIRIGRQNQVAGGNRAAQIADGTPSRANQQGAVAPTRQPMFSAGDLAKRQDLFADVATWDLNPFRDSRQPPLARHPPRTLRDSFAACLLTPLLHLAQDPDSPAGWRLLMFLPRILLRTSSAKRPDWSTVGARLIQFRQGLWRNLYDEAADAVSQPPQPRHAPDTTGILARAEGLAKRGNLAKSLQSLTATPVSPPSTDVLQALSARHPPACQAIPDWVREFTTDTSPSIHPRDFRRILAKCPNGVGAGPSGTTFEHLRDAALGNTDIFLQLHALTNTALAGKLSSEAAELLTASRLLAFAKPHGGTRPIAVGECLLRLVAKAALFLAAEKAREHFAPLQFGVAIAGGIEAAVHTARTYLEENTGAVALQIDLANAFNTVERAAVFEGLKGTTLEIMVPLVRLSYGAPSALHLDHAFHTPPLQSACGVRQGDPLGPLLFAASIHPCLVAAAEAHPEVVILAYADDITLLGEAAACTRAFTHLTSALLSLGLEHNPEKCAAWSAAHVDLASLPQHVPFSADGIRVLGSPIGPQPGCAAMVQERLSAAAEPLQLLSQMDPQLCLLLLTRCVSRRASYLVRTTLPEETWSAWGEQLLHTYLSAAHTAIPREEAERVRIWRQAALPVTLGGLGITNPATEGAFAYLASVISSAHLLHSFGDTVHPAIALMLPLMDAAADSPSANALRDKTHEAIAADELGLQGPFGSLGEEQLYQLLEDPTGQ
ncbi:unnamed protein product [Closterium sp. Naga37s-1]|nr:unnamed protein product [Closterium sp. Naga37s-1]